MSKVKVTKLSPAPQDVFFQETQFDDDLSGTDPGSFWRGQNRSFEPLRNANIGLAKSKKKRLRKAEQELQGHENKEAILKILRSE